MTFRHRPPPGTSTVRLAASFNADYSQFEKLADPDAAGFLTSLRY